MISALIDFITDHSKTVATSLTSVAIGQTLAIDTYFQRAAWIVAIVAGLMTVINLFFPLRTFYDEYKARNKKQGSN